ncbi:MAG TPA: hypothetical protein VFR11_19305 [Micromonosporaceae bacterium]|jgi:hypothetical protein|nr:hypothetical protein [Micromonosporaceae bacterium]
MSLPSTFTGIADIGDACTLPTAERPLRAAEFNAVFAGAVSAERLADRHLRIVLTGPADLPTRLRDLTRRETECCSFFTFTVTAQASDRAVLDIEVPDRHVAVLDGIEQRVMNVLVD